MATHENEDISPREQERLDRTFELLPQDVATGLEIGFYDFRVTDRLRQRMDLVSIDLPRPLPGHEGYKVAFADIQNLPFGDRAFDLVICTEVLEHLSETVLARGVEELQRVSRRYILVSVPYQQRFWNEMFRCAECGFVCNSMGHVQCMDEHGLLGKFAKSRPDKLEFIGKTTGYAPDWLYSAANRLGDSWQDYSFGQCPGCGKTNKSVEPNVFGFVLRRIIWRFERAAQSRPAWVLALLSTAA